MSLDDAMETEVTRREARREVARHGATWAEFTADHGDHETYLGATVLRWLGY